MIKFAIHSFAEELHFLVQRFNFTDLSINLCFVSLKFFFVISCVRSHLVSQIEDVLLLVHDIFSDLFVAHVVDFICLRHLIFNVFNLFVKVLDLVNSSFEHFFGSCNEVSHSFVAFFVLFSYAVNFLFRLGQTLAERNNILNCLHDTLDLQLLFLNFCFICSNLLINS